METSVIERQKNLANIHISTVHVPANPAWGNTSANPGGKTAPAGNSDNAATALKAQEVRPAVVRVQVVHQVAAVRVAEVLRLQLDIILLAHFHTTICNNTTALEFIDVHQEQRRRRFVNHVPRDDLPFHRPFHFAYEHGTTMVHFCIFLLYAFLSSSNFVYCPV